MTVPNTNLVHNFWIVGMLDILGQTEAMKDIDFVDEDMDQSKKELFERGVRSVYDATQLLHETIANWQTLCESTHPFLTGITTTWEAADFETAQSHPLKWQRFSDGLMMYTSLANPLEYCTFRPLYFLLGGCANALLTMFANETPIRGGITLGAGSELLDGELYGPAVARAHNLESKVADYPRIVIDPRLFDYLLKIHQSTGGGNHGDGDRKFADMCLHLIAQDVDGYPIVDFLGPEFLKQMNLTPNSPSITKAKLFVEKQYDEHRKNRCSKLAFRYVPLLNYFELRLNSEQQNTQHSDNQP